MISPPAVDHMVVLTHPSARSFCRSVARRWQARARRHNQVCEVRDLYHDRFDPVLKANEQPGKPGFSPASTIVAERRRLEKLDVLVFVYPVWFESPPAMLKGYLERVMGSGVAIRPEPQQRPLSSVRLVQISTSASSEPWLAERGIRGALETLYDQYTAQVFGAREVYRLHLDSICVGMSRTRASNLLARVDDLADRVCAEANVDRWNRTRTASSRRSRPISADPPD